LFIIATVGMIFAECMAIYYVAKLLVMGIVVTFGASSACSLQRQARLMVKAMRGYIRRRTKDNYLSTNNTSKASMETKETMRGIPYASDMYYNIVLGTPVRLWLMV